MTFGPEFLIAATGVVFAGFSRGFSGFGAALIAMPVLAVLYGPVEAVAVMTLLEVPATAMLLPSVIRHADWRAVMPLGLASLLTIPIGALGLVLIDPELLRKAIGVLVLLFAVLLATGWQYRQRPNLPVLLGIGGVSGVIGGAANMSGPLVVVFLLAGSNTAHEVRPGVMAYFSFSTLLRVAVFSLYGVFSLAILSLGALLVVPYLIGIWAGSRLFRGVSERLFRAVVLALVAAMGIVALVW